MIQINDTYSHTFRFTQAEVVRFAALTGDENPLHLDKDYAATTIFKQPIMHGFLGASVFSKVFGMLFPGEGTIYLKQSMDFLRPMLIETDYEATFEIKEIDSEKHRATVSTSITDKTTGKQVIKGEALVMHPTKL